MSSEKFIIKVEINEEANHVGVSLDGNEKQLMVALGCLVESMVKSAKISPNLIGNLVHAAIMHSEANPQKECESK